MQSEQAFQEEVFDLEEIIDLALANWASQNSLPETRTESIRNSILTEGRVFAMKPAWWRNLYGNLALTIRKSDDIRGRLKFPSSKLAAEPISAA